MKPAMNLSACGDVLSIKELAAVLRISPSEYYKLKSHGAFPIQPLPSLGGAVRYSKASVQRYLESAPTKLRRAVA
jgi:predicted DNA-binding transcriptional regulator AlpA